MEVPFYQIDNIGIDYFIESTDPNDVEIQKTLDEVIKKYEKNNQ